MTEVHHNFIIANYGGSQGFDNDDGSSWYNIHHNFIYGEGLKQDYGGHDSSYTDNLNVVHHYDGQNCFNTWTFVPGHEHVFKNNTCILLYDSNYADFQGACKICKGLGPQGRCMPDLANNKYYTPNGTVNLKCGNSNVPLADIQKLGSEVGSSAGTKPSDDRIMEWARTLLQMPPAPPPPPPTPLPSGQLTLFEKGGNGKLVLNASDFTRNVKSGRQGALGWDSCGGATFDNGHPVQGSSGPRISNMVVNGDWELLRADNCALHFDYSDLKITARVKASDGKIPAGSTVYFEVASSPLDIVI